MVFLGEKQWKMGDLLSKSWDTGDFFYADTQIPLNLLPYRYKMLQSINFYTYAKTEIEKLSNIERAFQEVFYLEEEREGIEIHTHQSKYTVDHVFDSRIDKKFKLEKHKYLTVLQHFKGWYIETKQDCFDDDRFTVMDYRMQW